MSKGWGHHPKINGNQIVSSVAGPLPLKVIPIKKHEPLRNISDHRTKRNGKEASMWNYLPNTVVGDDYIWRKNGHLWQIRLEDFGTWPRYEIGPAQPLGCLLFTACIYLLSAAHPFPGRSKFWWARWVGFYGIIQSFTPRWFSGSIETCQMRSKKNVYQDFFGSDASWFLLNNEIPSFPN